MSGLWIAAFVALWILVLVLAVLVLGGLRRVAAVLEGAERAIATAQVNLGAARSGMAVEPFYVRDDAGDVVTSDALFSAPTTFLLMRSGCEPCRQLAERLPSSIGLAVPLVVLLDDTTEARGLPMPVDAHVLFDGNGEASAAFRGGGTPQAFAVARGGVLVETLVPGYASDLERLADRLVKGGDAADIREPVPAAAI